MSNVLNSFAKNVKKKIRNLVIPGGYYFSKAGFCPCCDSEVTFEAYDSWLRDCFLCSNCHSLPRERALMLTIQKYFPDWKNLHIHESSPVNRGTSKKLKDQCSNYLSSQYYPGQTFGQTIDGHQNEDLENQTFQDSVFDLVITQDVFEHIYHPEKAFKEIGRTLKPGGAHIFTVPIINKHRKTEVWAKAGPQGTPIFLHQPEYHQNPVDINGSPVTMHWGYDIVDHIRDSSGLDTTIEYINDLNFGILAEYIEVLVSIKN